MCSALGTLGVPDNVRIIGLPTPGSQGGVREAPYVDQQILTSGVSKANGERGKLKAAINSLVGSPLVVTRDLWKMKPGHKPPHMEELHCSEAWQEAGLQHRATVLDASLRQRVGMLCSARCNPQSP